MKPAHVLVAVIFGGLLPVGGQSLPPQKAPEILRTSTDTNLLRWHGHQGRSYFLQVSDPSKHLEKWLWMPVIIAGADAEISQEVQTTGNKGFYRICYTDQVPGAGETLETADFDQDGLSNMSEISPQNGLATHPLNPDTDADGLKDGWEVSHAFNPHDSSDAAGDKDSDGLTNLQEYQWGANPTNPDTDGDGALDGDEKDGNTNLKDPESAPQEGWIVLTGDYPKEERKALKRTVTIPKGQTRVVVVVLHSEEYPEYTEYDSEFDDLLEWKITPTGGTEIAGQADVNDKHADWQLAESNGTAIKNFYPAHIEKVSSLTAPPEKDLIVTLELAATNISDDEKPSTAMVGLLPVEIKEVSFDGTKYWELWADDCGTKDVKKVPASNIYSAPHWKDVDGNGKPSDAANGERDYSVAYTRNTKPSIAAKFVIQGLPDNLVIKLRAKGSDGIEIAETVAQIEGNQMTLPSTESTTSWSDTIKFYDRNDANKAFVINWEIKMGESSWTQIASTKHQIYLTLGDPVTAHRQETLFFLSSKNADNLTNASSVTTAIWNEFIDRSVSRVDGFKLNYYQSYACQNYETYELLKFGDGQCGAWVKFFIDLRRVQGISDQPWRSLKPVAPSHGMIVNNWDFTGSGTSSIPGFPYFNIPGSPNHIGNTSYNWRFAEVNDHEGVEGQGNNANPASLFERHSVVFIGDEYLDPSYGVKYKTLQDLDDSMAGFFQHPGNYPGHALVDEPAVNLDLNNNETKTDLAVKAWVIAFQKNPPSIDLVETSEFYP